MADTFITFIEKERERLNKNREQLLTQQQDIQTLLDGIDMELEAIAAYENIKTGKKKRTKAGRSGGKRTEILALIGKKSMTRGDILEALGLKGNKSGEQSVSNALTALKKQKKLKRSEDGKYKI